MWLLGLHLCGDHPGEQDGYLGGTYRLFQLSRPVCNHEADIGEFLAGTTGSIRIHMHYQFANGLSGIYDHRGVTIIADYKLP